VNDQTFIKMYNNMVKTMVMIVFIIYLESKAGMKQNCGDSITIIYSAGYNISILELRISIPLIQKNIEKYTRE